MALFGGGGGLDLLPGTCGREMCEHQVRDVTSWNHEVCSSFLYFSVEFTN